MKRIFLLVKDGKAFDIKEIIAETEKECFAIAYDAYVRGICGYQGKLADQLIDITDMKLNFW